MGRGLVKKHRDEASLKRVYYNRRHPAAFSGVNTLHKALRGRISRSTIREWLAAQPSYTLHRSRRVKFDRDRFRVTCVDQLWQLDLSDLSSLSGVNDKQRYLLFAIDALSKFLWIIPLPNKRADTLAAALQTLLDSEHRNPEAIQSDKGGEFSNRSVRQVLAEAHVHYYTSQNSNTKAAIVERVQRTIKEKLWKSMTARNTRRYIDDLPDVVHAYNRTIHSVTKMRPVDVTRATEVLAWRNMYARVRLRTTSNATKRLKVGDWVRISELQTPFSKSFKGRWSEEIFRITARVPHRVGVFKICDYNSEPIVGTFYAEELQRVRIDPDKQLFHVERVIRRRTKSKIKEVFVKWKGYPATFNSWIRASELKSI